MTRFSPSLDTMGKIADVIGHDITKGHQVLKAHKLRLTNNIAMPLHMSFSHACGTDDYHLAAWKLLGECYIAVGVEPKQDTTTAIIINKPLLLKGIADKNIANYVAALETKKAIQTMDGYLLEMSHGIMLAGFRKGSSGKFTMLDMSTMFDK